MMRFISILFLCSSAFSQGLTLSDVAFISGGNSGAGGGGGGSPATAPSEYWSLGEASGNRIGEVSGTVIGTYGSSPSNIAGLYGNAALWDDTFTGFGPSQSLLGSSILSYTTGSDLSVNYWMRWEGTLYSDAFLPEFYLYANGESDVIQVIYNPHDGGGSQPTNTFRATIDNGGANDHVDTAIVNPTATWQMFTLTYDGTAHLLSFYLNGSLVGTTSTPVTYTSAGSFDDLFFFGTGGINSAAFDELYVNTSHALATDEITWLYNSGAGRQYSDF